MKALAKAHPCCHSRLQGKARDTLASRLRWKSFHQERTSGPHHTGHSSTCLRDVRFLGQPGSLACSPGLQGGHRDLLELVPPRERNKFLVKSVCKLVSGIQLVVISLREGLNGKKRFSFGHCPNHLNPPPMTRIRATWSSFFGSRNSRFESQFRTKNTIYTI